MVMRLVRQTASDSKPVRFGFIHSTYPSSIGDIRELQIVEQNRKDIIFKSYSIPYVKVPDGIPEMLKASGTGIKELSSEIDFWWQPQGPLLHFSPDLEAGAREAAKFTDAILKGLDPGIIPVTPPSKFKIGINMSTALKLKIVIPPDILELAGNDVYR
ncbi:MAG TPA: hypothetical protein DCY00_06245 [Actinobacteria bacterium]|nr:hypothetical protein [Actinomycetota bacterium]